MALQNSVDSTEDHRKRANFVDMDQKIEDPELLLNIIGSEFEFGTDNLAEISGELSKNQRRRRARRARSKYRSYEFDSYCSPVNSLINNRKNFSALLVKEPVKVCTIAASDVESKRRILDPNKKNDLKRLVKMKRNLETLQTISKSSNGDVLKIYKELEGVVVNLRLQEDITVPAHQKVLISAAPTAPGVLGDKLWIAKLYPGLSGVRSLQMPLTLIDKNITDRKSLCIYNISKTPLPFKKGTLIAEAKESFYSTLPVMDSRLIQEIENAEEKIVPPQKSPRQEAVDEFDTAIDGIENMKLKDLILEFKTLFIPSHDYIMDKIVIPPIELGTIHKEIKPTPPPARRHFSDRLDEAISNHIEIGLMNGLIQKQQSPTVSPIHAVEQNGKIRVVMDSRKINEQIELYNYVFPRLDVEIEELASGKFKIFSQTDLTGAFNQLEVHEKSRFLLAFAASTKRYRGTFAYTRLPFGIKSSPAIFASVLDNILNGINDATNETYVVKSFIDDIVIGAVDETAMLYALRLVFARLKCYNVKLRLSKSNFMSEKTSYCGIDVSKDGYRISEKRRKILDSYPDFDVLCRRKNNDLKYLGFYNWHRRFVPNYSQRDREFRNIVAQYKEGNLDAPTANEKIKEITDDLKKTIGETMLVTPSKNDTMIIHTDASKFCWGYVLSCDRGVISYGGGAFSATVVRSHNIWEKETMSMSNALSDAFKLIVNGKNLVVKNDNMSLISVNRTNKSVVTPRMVKYLMNIIVLAQQLPVNFVHLNTLDNSLADFISRLQYNDDGTIRVTMITTGDQLDAYKFVKKLHDNHHWSVDKTVSSLGQYGLPVDRFKHLIKRVWNECPSCGKYKRSAPLKRLTFRENPEEPFSEISIDHIIKIHENKSTDGYTCALTVKCTLTRYFMAFPAKDVQIRTVILQLQACFMITGRVCKRIYSDNAFDTVSMRKFCKSNGIEIKFRPANLSRSVSVERTHRTLHEKISSLLKSRPKSNWDKVLWKACISINMQVNSSTGYSPYFLFYGHDPPGLGCNDLPRVLEPDPSWSQHLCIAKQNADDKRMESSEHPHLKYPILDVGQKVWIKSDGSKNVKHRPATVLADEGGSSVTVELDNRKGKIKFHKGHVYLAKPVAADLSSEVLGHMEDQYTPSELGPEPIASRLRSRS